MIQNSGRKMSIGIIATWLFIALANAVAPLLIALRMDNPVLDTLKELKPVIVAIPPSWAAAAVFFYYGRNISPDVWKTVIMSFLRIKPTAEPTVVNNVQT